MPRASWRGFLRLSLVSCPIYLSPATTRAKSIRLHQVWQPAPVDAAEDALCDRGEGPQGSAPSAPRLLADETPSPVIDLMAALKRSLAQEPSAPEQKTAKRKRTKQEADQRQPVLLLPLTGTRKGNQRPSAAAPALGGASLGSSLTEKRGLAL